MVDTPKVVFDIDVHHVVVASVGRQANGLQRLRGAPFRPESIGHRQKVGLENWLNDELGRHLNQFSRDRKSTRLNSSHDQISYAVFCLKKKKKTTKKTLI